MSANKALRRLHKRIISLREEIINLQCLLNDSDEARQADERQASERIWAVRREAEQKQRRLQHIADDERSAAQSRKGEYDRVARDLERAVSWKQVTGRDPFGDIERCTQKLRRM